jgi:hypothetical protein
MLLAKWEHSSGFIQNALLQSGSSSREYAVNAAWIPTSIASVASSGIRASSVSMSAEHQRLQRQDDGLKTEDDGVDESDRIDDVQIDSLERTCVL